MPAIVQSFFPKIEFYHEKKSLYKTFSASDKDYTSSSVTSYGYRKSVRDFSGNFSITVTENDDNFIGNVIPLDIVKIFNSDTNLNADFIGVVTNITYTSRANGSRVSTITGRDISYLFEMFNITFDTVALSCVTSFPNKEATNYAFTLSLNGEKNINIKEAIVKAYNYFCDISNKNNEISNTEIQDEISYWFGNDFIRSDYDINFMLPISSNIFSMTLATFPSYVRNLLPENVYEFFSIIDSYGNPVLICREKPFDVLNGWTNSWENLPITHIDSMYLTDYTLTRSIDEVYTAFLPYVEGSTQSADFYEKISALNGYQGIQINEEKKNKYGFKILQTNFVGFNTDYADDDKKMNSISKNMYKLSERMKNWYGINDELYNAEINCIYNGKMAKVGERVSFLGGEFYITNEEVTWKYGSSPTIKYTCERGAIYSGNTITPLKDFSKKLSEVTL